MAAPKTFLASSTKAVPAAGFANPNVSTNRMQTINRRLAWLFATATVLSLTALSISGYLSYVAFTSSKILGCGGGVFNCDHVLTSKWSTLLGLPVAAWAGSLYLGVLTALVATARPAMSTQSSLMQQWSWSIVTAAAVSAGLAALWFTGLQVFVLEHLCPWCLAAHTCGILLCLGTLCFSPLTRLNKAMCASLGFTATLGLVVIQLLTPAPQTYDIKEFPETPLDGGVIEEPQTFDAPGADGGDVFMAPDAQSQISPIERWFVQVDQAVRGLINPAMMLTTQTSTTQEQPAAEKPADGQNAEGQAAAAPRTVHLSMANIKLRPEQWPMLGSTDAPKIFVEMYDYTCKHCRRTQKAIHGARATLGSELGIIMLPVPLNRNCNPAAVGNPNKDACELAETALAVWKADKTKFEEFHEWLMQGDNPPSAAAALAKAQTLVDPKALAAEKSTAQKFIRSNVSIYQRMNGGPVPKLIFPTTVMTGEIQDPNALVTTINRQPPPK